MLQVNAGLATVCLEVEEKPKSPQRSSKQLMKMYAVYLYIHFLIRELIQS